MSVEWMQDAAEWMLTLWALLLVVFAPVLVALFVKWVREADHEDEEW